MKAAHLGSIIGSPPPPPAPKPLHKRKLSGQYLLTFNYIHTTNYSSSGENFLISVALTGGPGRPEATSSDIDWQLAWMAILS